jgi:hypothetical protein
MREPTLSIVRLIAVLIVPCAALLLCDRMVNAAEPLEARVAAVLARNCLECHNGSDRKGGLDLTRREAARRSSPVIPRIVRC